MIFITSRLELSLLDPIYFSENFLTIKLKLSKLLICRQSLLQTDYLTICPVWRDSEYKRNILIVIALLRGVPVIPSQSWWETLSPSVCFRQTSYQVHHLIEQSLGWVGSSVCFSGFFDGVSRVLTWKMVQIVSVEIFSIFTRESGETVRDRIILNVCQRRSISEYSISLIIIESEISGASQTSV